MKFLSVFLCSLLFFACQLGTETKKSDTSTNGSSSLALELDGMFKIGDNSFDPVSTAANNYQILLKKGATYSLKKPADKGIWNFIVGEGLSLVGDQLTVPATAQGSFTLEAQQTDPNYDQMSIYFKIVPTEKSIFDGNIELFAGSQTLENVLDDLSTNLELSTLRVQLQEQDIDSTKFDWEYKLFTDSSNARALNPGATVVAEGAGSFVIEIEKLQVDSVYTLVVTARSRDGDIAGTISKEYILKTASELRANDIFPILFYPSLAADRSGATTVQPILTGNLGNGTTTYTLGMVDGVTLNNASTGELTFAAGFSGEFTVELTVAASNNYNSATASYSSAITATAPTTPLTYYRSGADANSATSLVNTVYESGLTYKVLLPSGWNSADVTYVLEPSGIVSIDGNTKDLQILKAGKVKITATHATDEAQATFTISKAVKSASISYTVDRTADLPWTLTPNKTGNDVGRNGNFYLSVAAEIATIADDGTLTVKRNQSFSVSWILEPNENYSSATATWNYQAQEPASDPDTPHFTPTELSYDSEEFFEFVHTYPANESEVKFLFGASLNTTSPYFEVSGEKLSPKKAGEQLVKVRVLQNNQLVHESQTLLKVLPKEVELEYLGEIVGQPNVIREITLPATLAGFNLQLMGSTSSSSSTSNLKFYSYKTDTAEWQESDNGSFLCAANTCKFGVKASAEESYKISITSNDNNLEISGFDLTYQVIDGPALSYSLFRINDENDEITPMKPIWRIATPNDLNFTYQESVTGLSIDSTTGELKFDTLANLAAAAGKTITISAGVDALQAAVPLKIKAYDHNITDIVELFINASGIGPDGNYNAIDTSDVQDMTGLFSSDYRYFDDIYELEESNDSSYSARLIFRGFNGNISQWDTSKVSNMSHMFNGAISFNGDLSDWDTSKVVNMSSMFRLAQDFNQNINSWDTHNVEDMSSMFASASSFNGNINTNGNKWNTAKVRNMSAMFEEAESFNQALNNWNTSNVTNMGSMFEGASVFNANINTNSDYWITSKVVNMSSMFSGAAAFNQDISDWDTSAVVNMSHMFSWAEAFNQNINTDGNKWSTSKVVNMSWMFEGAKAFNQDISDWDTSQVLYMAVMFSGTEAFNQDISDWDTSKVRDMRAMFSYTGAFNQDISDWDTSKVRDMDSMFSRAKVFNQPLNTDGNKWNTSKVTDMSYMFTDTEAFNQDISDWDTSAVLSMSSMFSRAKVFNQPLNTDGNKWNVSKVTDMGYMFSGAEAFNQDITNWNVRRANNNDGLDSFFQNATAFNNQHSDGETTAPEDYFTVLQ